MSIEIRTENIQHSGSHTVVNFDTFNRHRSLCYPGKNIPSALCERDSDQFVVNVTTKGYWTRSSTQVYDCMFALSQYIHDNNIPSVSVPLTERDLGDLKIREVIPIAVEHLSKNDTRVILYVEKEHEAWAQELLKKENH